MPLENPESDQSDYSIPEVLSNLPPMNSLIKVRWYAMKLRGEERRGEERRGEGRGGEGGRGGGERKRGEGEERRGGEGR